MCVCPNRVCDVRARVSSREFGALVGAGLVLQRRRLLHAHCRAAALRSCRTCCRELAALREDGHAFPRGLLGLGANARGAGCLLVQRGKAAVLVKAPPLPLGQRLQIAAAP